MKITKQMLKELIKEELENLAEMGGEGPYASEEEEKEAPEAAAKEEKPKK